MNKNEIRHDILALRKAYDGAKSSGEICENVKNMPEFKAAKDVALFVPYKSEVDIRGLIKDTMQSKNVYLPVTDEEDNIEFYLVKSLEELSEGKYNILQPKQEIKAEKIDFMLMPGVAFDKKGHRIGYGKGCYDRYLDGKDIFTCAVGYSFQLRDEIPHERHDKAVKAFADEVKVVYF